MQNEIIKSNHENTSSVTAVGVNSSYFRVSNLLYLDPGMSRAVEIRILFVDETGELCSCIHTDSIISLCISTTGHQNHICAAARVIRTRH